MKLFVCLIAVLLVAVFLIPSPASADSSVTVTISGCPSGSCHAPLVVHRIPVAPRVVVVERPGVRVIVAPRVIPRRPIIVWRRWR
jgi:hypothetical protein